MGELHQAAESVENLKARMTISQAFNSKTNSYRFNHLSQDFSKNSPGHSKQLPHKTQLHSQMYLMHSNNNSNKDKFHLKEVNLFKHNSLDNNNPSKVFRQPLGPVSLVVRNRPPAYLFQQGLDLAEVCLTRL